jgi:hypothetical protein
MPQCPICHAAVWVGQRYCSTCDNYLPHPEEADHFCPRCGIRMAPQQKLCHKCKASSPQLAGTSAVTARSWSLFPLGTLIFLATGLAIVVLLWLFLRHQTSGPEWLAVTSPPQAPAEQTPAAPPIPTTAETAPWAPTTPAAQKPAVISEPTISFPPKETPSFPIYTVNVEGLALRDGPNMSAPKIATLDLDDEVELLETSGGWGKIRDVQRNTIGWSYMRYLTPRED